MLILFFDLNEAAILVPNNPFTGSPALELIRYTLEAGKSKHESKHAPKMNKKRRKQRARQGGEARAESLTAKERREIAKKAAEARWKKNE